MTFNPLSAGMSYFPWDRLSDAGDWLVVTFGMTVCVTCIFSVFCLGIRAMFPTIMGGQNTNAVNVRNAVHNGRTKTMKYPVHVSKRVAMVYVTAAIILIATGLLESARSHGQTPYKTPQESPASSNASSSEPALDLSSSQLNAIKVEQVGSYLFPVEEEAVGSIDFDGNLSVQVFPLFQGTILDIFVELGAQVQKEQPLYTIKSPDLIQAESTLIGAAATFELTRKELVRAKDLYATNVGVAQRELEQAISDEQTAEGALKAARDAVRVFGKTDAEIDQMIASRKIDPALVVRSPISGKDHIE